MEVAFISFVINKLGGIAVDQAQSTCSQLLLHCTAPPLDQIDARAGRITAEFELMRPFLEGFNWSTAAAADKMFEAWIKQANEVAFKMEDAIDEYLYQLGRQRKRTWKNCCVMAPSDLCCSFAKAWRDIDSRLEEMERLLSELLRRKDRYGLTLSGDADRVKNSETNTHHRASLPMLINEDDLVGIEENKSKLLSWLTDAYACSGMTTIAVWGMGGQGKTTLVANVYRDNTLKNHFDYQVWVTVSQTYSLEVLLRTIIQEIFKSKMEPAPNDITTMPLLRLCDIIRDNLQQKRYIIVLDDVWRVDSWNDILSRVFIDSNNGSKLIVTTRNHEVARIAREEHIIELQQLNEKDSRILFCKNAFRREDNKNCPKELEDYTVGILNKCQGSPLAIAAIGSLLSFKGKRETEWKKVHDRLRGELQNNPALDIVKNILNLSFNDLANNLKNCFVYCSIFPEDYLIKRKKLTRLWIAEGFVEATNSNIVMEEEAEDYLAELVDRSMLQVVYRNEFGRPKAFRMHDVLREVTLSICRKAKFCMILDGSQPDLDNQTRRLSIQTNDESIDLKKSLPRLRSLVMFSTSNFSSVQRTVLNSYKTLMVLELEGVTISNLPNKVSALFNLRYLGLRNTEVEQLPKDIQKLQNLQTLDLRNSMIKKLPHGVTQLKQLRHLIATRIDVEFGGAVPTLEGEWQWKNLQTLRSIKATDQLVQLLGDMKELRSLDVVEVQQAHCPQLCASLTKMRNLRRLSLFTRGEEQLNFEMLNSPFPPLQKLELWGRLFEGKFPRFICSCAELTHVELCLAELIEDPLPSLAQLPKLVELGLRDNAFVGQKLHFRTGWFLDLKKLYLSRLENLNDIVIEEGATISLRELFMVGLKELKMVPRGIELLTHLQYIYLVEIPNELVKKLRKDYDNKGPPRIHII